MNGDKSLHIHCPKPGGMTTLNAMEGWVWQPGYEFPKGELQTSRWPVMSNIGNIMSLSQGDLEFAVLVTSLELMPPDFGRSGCLANKTQESGLQLLRWMLCVLIFPRNSWLTLLFSKWLLSENISRGCRNHVLRAALTSSVLGRHCVRKSFQRRTSSPLLLREKTAGGRGGPSWKAKGGAVSSELQPKH